MAVNRSETDLCEDRRPVAGSGLRFAPRGEPTLKGVPAPTPLFALVGSGER